MTYRELLALYKSGRLDERRRHEVEADIEKQDAIGEYLYEESEIPGLGALKNSTAASEPEAEDAGDERFTSIIQSSIRKSFIKMGITVGAVVLAMVLCVVFLLPRVVSLFYYNPTTIVAESTVGGIGTNRMSLDLSVYSELFLPGHYRDSVVADSEGYGKYGITIPQEVYSADGSSTTLIGTLKRGKLSLYNPDILRKPAANLFMPPDSAADSIGPAGAKADNGSYLETLDESQWYEAYVSLADVTDYADFDTWFQTKNLSDYDLWCAVYCKYGSQPIGLTPRPAGVYLDWDRDAYPDLSLLQCESESDAAAIQTHFISMISYLRDHPDILKVMGMGSEGLNYNIILQDVEKNGLRLYGFAITAKKDTILELSRDPAVSYIYASVLK
ncbi:MAG: anti-sigma factor C-terminal domain-containing protein [Oscillospiraceae bacterium]|nr:anti-sigma factor C-terminal domain-containing protein [Oscillospiraceae bacterium]